MALGWYVAVSRARTPTTAETLPNTATEVDLGETVTIAEFQSGISGLNWIDDLVAEHRAVGEWGVYGSSFVVWGRDARAHLQNRAETVATWGLNGGETGFMAGARTSDQFDRAAIDVILDDELLHVAATDRD